ncbi:hypothetical protein C8D76_103105 [Pasteurella langaaensis DSM 22999]|uniref:Uncharacterized protein n=2 Tax=Pasteurellaceae TaxID=712 RepID=A0A2U0TA87_9PAST|nr:MULTISPECIES: hypothetical protein [Pasteurellaceae]OBW98136.1 hypothetical protein QV04_09680 [Gallibacterium genomosp. 1]OBW98689.1 hypothetical protein QV05_10575 [Gallibacterium genomosp. 1]PVX40532.1 hypothetical protein C8D76_103105 [Pasteurella langaaensis DSM 22999]
MKNTVLTPTKTRNLSPEQYLMETKKNKVSNNIERVKFIPPKANSRGYGSFQVTYKMPVLVAR